MLELHALKRKKQKSQNVGATMKSVAYYITGHGLGHATRSLEVIRALLEVSEDDFPLVYISSMHLIIGKAKQSFFIDQLGQALMTRVTLHTRVLDAGRYIPEH